MIRKILFTFSFTLLLFKMSAQNDLKIGQWRTHLPYKVAAYVTQSNTHVFWSTGLSILQMNKTDFSSATGSFARTLKNICTPPSSSNNNNRKNKQTKEISYVESAEGKMNKVIKDI